MKSLREIEFVASLTESQNDLLVYIAMLLGGDGEAAKDVLQETNIYLWAHWETFDPSKGTFLTWARAQARYKVLQYRRDAAREERHLVFDQETFEAVAETLAAPEASTSERSADLLTSLRHCLDLLPADERNFIEARYFSQKPFKSLAEHFHLSVGTAEVRMCRLRKQLADCVRRRICALERRTQP